MKPESLLHRNQSVSIQSAYGSTIPLFQVIDPATPKPRKSEMNFDFQFDYLLMEAGGVTERFIGS